MTFLHRAVGSRYSEIFLGLSFSFNELANSFALFILAFLSIFLDSCLVLYFTSSSLKLFSWAMTAIQIRVT